MKPMMRGLALAGVTLILAVGTMITTAQDQGGQGRQGRQGGQGGQGGPGGGRGFDPAQMQEMMLQNIQEDLSIADDEWTAIKPMVASVMEKQMQQGFRGMGFGGRRGGPGGGPGGPGAQADGNNARGNRPRGFGPEPSPEEQALNAALDSETTSAEDLKAKLTAYRDSQKKKAAELQKAREELRAVLTVRQEAQLVLRGMLD